MMAKFRGAQDPSDPDISEDPGLEQAEEVRDRSIGEILIEMGKLSPDQVQRIVELQRERGIRFGEAAIAIGYVVPEDILRALSEQFHYPYANEDLRKYSSELVALNQPFGLQAESFRAIRSQIAVKLNSDSAPRPALAVVSPSSGDGKTFFCANLAVSLAQLGGGRTLLIDADMRGPRLHKLFGIEQTGAGLSGILVGRGPANVIKSVPGVEGLFLLPVGTTPPNPLELVERPAFSLLLRELTTKFDHVIVDTPAAVYGADCAVVASRCGAALVLARRDASSADALQDLVGVLSGSACKVLGVVYNDY